MKLAKVRLVAAFARRVVMSSVFKQPTASPHQPRLRPSGERFRQQKHIGWSSDFVKNALDSRSLWLESDLTGWA
jgi:hypothetical protein